MTMWTWFHKLASPPHAFRLLDRIAPWLGGIAAILIVVGAWWGLVRAPADYQQGDGFRILYVHAPAAWLSLSTYVVMATAAAIGLIWRIKLAHAAAAACAPVGAAFTFLALVTGSIWGKPMWGTWWVWDARLTSELILLFLYLGYMAFRASFDDLQRADRASAILAIVGVINVPIIHYSVEWWTTLHQPASVTRLGKPTIAMSMLIPLFIMLVGYQIYFGWVLCRRLQGEIVRRERTASWLQDLDGTT
jgi:heme exporter protein C